MSNFLPAKYIIVEFLRNRLIDPRARSEATDTDSFTATASQTNFILTPSSGSVSCITSVTVDAVAKTKWQDYWFDMRNQTIKFYTGLSIGQAVVATYKYGTSNWIYWDKARVDLSATSFPRLNILTITGTGRRLGQYTAEVESQGQYQIDIWTKKDQVFTISSRVYEGEELAEYIASKVTEAFEDYESDLFPALYAYDVPQIARDLPYDETYQCFHQVIEITLRGLKLNRIN